MFCPLSLIRCHVSDKERGFVSAALFHPAGKHAGFEAAPLQPGACRGLGRQRECLFPNSSGLGEKETRGLFGLLPKSCGFMSHGAHHCPCQTNN